MTTDTVLVTGATGNTGRPLVELLLGRGVPVRAMVRSAAGREQLAGLPVEVIVADLDDPDAVSVALAGVQRAYLVTPSSERAQDQQERSSSPSSPRTKDRRSGSCVITPPSSGGSASSASGSPSCAPICTSRAYSP
jgi:uncharacterized protein YbjT (DUF2867 family)